MAEILLNAKKREISTKGAVNQLRRDGQVPGVFYSKEADAPLHFSVEAISLNKLIYTSETHMVKLAIDGKEEFCILKKVQFDPVSGKPIHVDFHGVKFGEKIQLQVPVSLIGDSIGVKEGGVLTQQNHKLDIECLPRQIPEKLEVDITELNIGDSVFVRDLSYDDVDILNSEDTVIVSITTMRAEEEVEAEVDELLETEESAEPEVIAKGKSETEEEEQE